MSRIAIAAAMHEELGALLAAIPDELPTVIAGREFWTGHLEVVASCYSLAIVRTVLRALPR